jgi:alkyl sulfatase BDS1-like metallo-beta-lactamase superfamily hydrolase
LTGADAQWSVHVMTHSSPDHAAPQPATEHTRQLHARAAALLCFDDEGDFERARRGLLATLEGGKVMLGEHTVWDTARHDFVRHASEVPDTVHPGLFRQARLNSQHGLFQVVEGIYQARGYDLSNITFVAGKRGWVIIDPLTTAATAAACLGLANRQLGARPVSAVIYTHSHVDHYGGVLGVTSREAVSAGDVQVLAPAGFLAEAVSENVIAGPVMARRALYQFGPLLPPGPRTHVDSGLGTALPLGPAALIAPTEEIGETGAERVVDGVRIVFQNTPGSEAPAEMNFFFPELRALCLAENCTHTLHNLYPLRGAQVRDALAWSKYIDQALCLFGADTETSFASHHWPRFGRDDVRGFLELQRDAYRYLHDQTMRLANRGLKPTEIAEQVRLPACYASHSHVAGYYGTVSHNVKAVYQRYLGFYDGNPAHLHPLPEAEAARKYVEFMGGAEALLARAGQCFERGEYRWVAQVVNHLVFADPDNRAARSLQAAALEQLGYQAESATWRNAYLMGAQELRQGSLRIALGADRQQLVAMTAAQIFDTLGVRFDPTRFEGERLEFNLRFSDLNEDHVLGIAHGALHHRPLRRSPDASVSCTLSRAALARLLTAAGSLELEVSQGQLEVQGEIGLLARLLGAIERTETGFALIEP